MKKKITPILNRPRHTYINPDSVTSLKYFIKTIKEKNEFHVKLKLNHSLNLVSVIKLLMVLNKKSCRFSELYCDSEIRWKRGFLNYLNTCLHFKFVYKKCIARNHTEYYITAKGKLFLSLFADI